MADTINLPYITVHQRQIWLTIVGDIAFKNKADARGMIYTGDDLDYQTSVIELIGKVVALNTVWSMPKMLEF